MKRIRANPSVSYLYQCNMESIIVIVQKCRGLHKIALPRGFLRFRPLLRCLCPCNLKTARASSSDNFPPAQENMQGSWAAFTNVFETQSLHRFFLIYLIVRSEASRVCPDTQLFGLLGGSKLRPCVHSIHTEESWKNSGTFQDTKSIWLARKDLLGKKLQRKNKNMSRFPTPQIGLHQD